ncbi:MAG: flippase-like domain-containing protein [Kiritimatiellae bacterium]|nr:flippase-like domain-containing protein [Kiritimatiellia bacterium]MDW8459447.1 lysylphosphatidylglycerol synthase transmembrane domain-containing protein [Verrucomicrobiota bacterium]
MTFLPRAKAARSLLRWLLAAGLLAALFVAVPAREVASVLAEASPAKLSVAAALFLAGHAAHTGRLWLLIRAVRLRWTWREVAHFHFTSMAYALALPGGSVAGTAVRIYRLSDGGRELGASSAALIVDRLAATLTLGLSGLLCAGLGSFHADPPVLTVMLAVFAGGSILMALAVAGAARVPFAAAWLAKRGLSQGAPIRPALTACAISLGVHVIGIAAFTAAAGSLGLMPGVLPLGYARAAMIIAAMLPISVAGLGVRESAALLVLGGMGVPPDRAVGLSFMVFILGWLLPALLGGFLEIAALLRRTRQAETRQDLNQAP